MLNYFAGNFMWMRLFRLFITSYLAIGYRITRLLGLRLRGVGFLLRRLDREFSFEVEGRRFLFSPQCGAAYCLMPGGLWNEPETHRFFRNILQGCAFQVVFIDVGASIGEMAIDAAGFESVDRVLAFEPDPGAADAIRASAGLNTTTKIEVFTKAVGSFCGETSFISDKKAPTSSHLCHSDSSILGATNVEIITLDSIQMQCEGELLILVDVEGFEPGVLRGALSLIKRKCPLIIFEYNETSQRHFSLNDIKQILGQDYEIFKLLHDGRLSTNLEHTWNCVALNRNSNWSRPCLRLLLK